MTSTNDNLSTPIEFLKGVGPAKAALLNKELGIFTFKDLLEHYPFRYVDKTKVYQISEIHEDLPFIQVKGKLTGLKIMGKDRGKRLVGSVYDGTGSLELVWFKGVTYMQKFLQLNQEYLVYGKPNVYKGRVNIPHPEMEQQGLIRPPGSQFEAVYSSTEKLKSRGLDSKGIGRLFQVLFTKVGRADLPEYLPDSFLQNFRLSNRYEALKEVHLPTSEAASNAARLRIKFDELLFIQLSLLSRKVNRIQKVSGIVFEGIGKQFHTYFNDHLAFELTGAQKRVLKEIRRDTRYGSQMNRLLQGDVGSGKTVVALMSMLMAVDNGLQACMMAPTEILAQQHFKGLCEELREMDVQVEILTGSVKGKKRKEVLERLAQGEIDILTGTHALIEPTVKFKQLGIAVIDEQHRFGVAQRARLWAKNEKKPPHVLVMTATPIPRTLAMTLYGDLDVSVIDELPPGRKSIQTMHLRDKDRLRVFRFMREQIDKGRQVYVVYPLIQESETMDYKDLMDGFDSVTREFPLPKYAVSIVHGKMKPADKEYEMQRFVKGETQIMVATTVIEVGVNVPNASVMVIESSERFGLSQLHQLRGRVGRGADQSYCILLTGNKLTNDGRKRIRAMVDTNDGFKIAELDLQLRGPGILSGTQQSGMEKLKLASLTEDTRLLARVRSIVEDLLEEDPQLEKEENAKLKLALEEQNRHHNRNWSRIS